MSRLHTGSIIAALVLSACGLGGDDSTEAVDQSEEALMLSSPSISAMTPTSGPTTGGTAVEVRGSNFARGITATLGGIPVVGLDRDSRSVLRFKTPPRQEGTAVLKIRNPNGRSLAGPSFTYVAATPPPPPPPPVATTDGGTTTPPPPPSPGSCALNDSGPVQVTTDGQIIENLRIRSTNGEAVAIEGHSNVVIRNCEIFHDGGPGIAFADAPGLLVQNVRIVHAGAPAKGPNPSDDRNSIEGFSSTGVVIENVRVERGSTGVYVISSPGIKVRFIEAHDIRGPFPRGQIAQFDKSNDAILEDFSVENLPEVSWPEDNVSFFQSARGIARRGLIVGNNSPSGVGVMFEAYDMIGTGGLVEDVDTIDMGNGSFSAYPSRDVIFRRARTRDTHCGSQQGRGTPLSNALLFGAPPESSNIRIEGGKYYNHCNPDNLVWDDGVFTSVDLAPENFTPRAPQRLSFCWNPPAF